MSRFAELFATIDAKNADGFAAFINENGRFVYGSGQPAVGRRAIRDFVAGFFSSLTALSHELVGEYTTPEATFVEGRVTYTLGDGRRVTVPFLNKFTFAADGLIQDYLVYTDPTPLAG